MVRHYALMYGFLTLPNMLKKPLRERRHGCVSHWEIFSIQEVYKRSKYGVNVLSFHLVIWQFLSKGQWT